MKKFAVMGVLILIITCLIVFAYYRMTIGFVSLFNKKERKDYSRKGRAVFLVISVMLTALSVNFFSAVGIVLAHFIVFASVMQLVNVIVKFLFVDKKLKVWNVIVKSLVIPVILTAIFIIYGHYNIHNVIKTEYTVYTNEVTEEYDIVFIADIHYGTVLTEDEIDEIFAQISEENADVIILGGDMVDESTKKEDIIMIYDKLSELKNELGIIHVEGNHDRQKYSGKPTLSDEEYEEYKLSSTMNFLEDNVIQVNNELVIAGRLDVSEESRMEAEELLKGIDESKFLIVADHQPREYEKLQKAGANLVLSGHTHAGQIFPAGLFTTIIGGAEQNYGLKMEKNMPAIVTSGLTGWGFPIRTSKHCEYVVVHIKPE